MSGSDNGRSLKLKNHREVSILTEAFIIARNMGGNIVKASDMDALIKKGEDSRRAREAAIKRRREEEERKKREEEMKKLVVDSGTVSQGRRGKGF
ncbi:hypothetical protein F4677DRAFT_451091 [Hypoxylon crocopeplum]|nr:hypothetical protein F4677DRAFT_451091 [Hypoxylon crocopeplum]